MNQEQQGTNEVLMDTMITKLEQQDQRIQTQEKKTEVLGESLKKVPDVTKDIFELKTSVRDFNTTVKDLKFPAEKMQEFSGLLTKGIDLLSQPTETRVQHHHQHHVKKGLVIAIASILVNFFLSAALYLSHERGQQFEANDIKYRALRLEGSQGLNEWLAYMDSVYQVHPDRVRNFVLQEEQKRLSGLVAASSGNNNPANGKVKAGEKKKKGQ